MKIMYLRFLTIFDERFKKFFKFFVRDPEPESKFWNPESGIRNQNDKKPGIPEFRNPEFEMIQ